MGKKEQFEKPERESKHERKREMVYQQGDVVFARHKSLWSVGTFVRYNKNGTMRIRLGAGGVDLKFFDVAHKDR